MLTAWPDYLVDAAQRSVLFLDLLRRRGNEQLETAAVPLSTVLRFEHEVLMDGRSLPRCWPCQRAHSALIKQGKST